jgi:signal transduction histidine kinase
MLVPTAPHEAKETVLPAEALHDIRGAVETIEKRSQALLHFVDAYRKLARIPKPNFQILSVADLFRRVETLLQQHISSNKISFSTSVNPTSLELTADPELVEQVLINLLRNAVDAVGGKEGATISMTGRVGDQGRVIVEVTDNGLGISKDMAERIFVPFFTTKPNGSGIGLSLSRQVMRAHRGSIYMKSEPNVRTTFALRF